MASFEKDDIIEEVYEENEETSEKNFEEVNLEDKDQQDENVVGQNDLLGESRNAFSIHLQRQAQLCKLALQAKKYKYLPESVSKIGAAFEEYLFNPRSEEDKKQQDARLNFYPPFAVPECTANYYSFFSILPVPFSCSANRTATEKLLSLKHIKKYDYLPDFDPDMFTVSEALGSEVTATDSLPRKTRLVTLEADYDRLLTMKHRLRHVTQFAYPALNLPPKIHRVLIETLFKPYQRGTESVEEVDYVISREKIAKMRNLTDEEKITEAVDEFRTNLLKAIQYLVGLEMMEKMFRNAGFIKKIQEILHYTFHHGFIRLIGHVTNHNLSNYITFHGMTFQNRNNNATLQSTLDLNEGEDYMIDTIFLFLIYNWQTAMGIWQQNLNELNLKALKDFLISKRDDLVFCSSAGKMARVLMNWITDDQTIIKIFQDYLPDFVSQMQLNNFRNFILARSNIIGGIIPAMVKDFVPVDYKESSPLLWGHVYLFRLSYFLYQHGDYMQIFYIADPEERSAENEVFCNCNLCAPHRTPMYNSSLHNEILAIDSFDFFVPTEDGNGGQRVTLSAGMWANKFLDHFVKEEFFPFEVMKYIDYPEIFNVTPTACVINKPHILSTLRHIQKQREKFLLEKGSGIYLDPETGDNLSDAKFLSQPSRASVNNITTTRKYSKGRPNSQEKKKKNPR